MERAGEIAAALDHLRYFESAADGHRIQDAVGPLRRAVIAVGEALAAGSPAAEDVLDAFCARACPRLRRAYRAAGYPCGPDEDGMWRWLRQHAATAAEAERAANERAWRRGLATLRREIDARRAAGTAADRELMGGGCPCAAGEPVADRGAA
jgi:hypothetical protein